MNIDMSMNDLKNTKCTRIYHIRSLIKYLKSFAHSLSWNIYLNIYSVNNCSKNDILQIK